MTVKSRGDFTCMDPSSERSNLDEDRVCYHCGKRWGQHYDNFCRLKDKRLYLATGRTAAKTFVHDGGRYCTPQGKIFRNTTKDDPNFLFKRRK